MTSVRAVAGLSIGCLLAAPAAAAAIDPETSDVSVGAIATVPGSRAGTYATPVVVIERGADLSFVNTEPFPHDVRSVAMGPDDVSWCEPYDRDEPAHAKRNPRQFPKGKCPLLWSPAIAMTTGAVETKVHGTKNLKPGTSVEFYCTNFPDMRGTVVVR